MIALDTRSVDGPVWWLDHGMVGGKASYQSHSKFSDWVEQFYRETRSDLEGDGIDPEGEAKAEAPMTGWGVLRYFLSLIGVAVLGLAVLFAIFWVKSMVEKTLIQPNPAHALDGGIPPLFHSECHWPAASDVRC